VFSGTRSFAEPEYASSFSAPKGFLWGAATSSHQVEGNNVNDWSDWEASGRTKELSGMACDHYRRYREDFRLARSLGQNAHRFSIEWSRVEPEEGHINEGALLHYHEVIRDLRENALEPVVTLNHFTLPHWVAQQGGWTSSHVVQQFGRFTECVAERLGKEVRYWVTLNEPMVLVYMAYVQGKWPPGRRSKDEALLAVKNMAEAHAHAYRTLHQQRSDCWVGLAKHVRVFEPHNPFWPPDYFSAWLRDFSFNDFILDAISGKFSWFPGYGSVWKENVRNTLDFVGLNYYTRDFVQFSFSDPLGVTRKDAVGARIEERNSLGWEIYAHGLYRALRRVRKYRRPIMVMENGLCTLRDERRIVFIQKHIRALFRAMAEGVDVRGYFYTGL